MSHKMVTALDGGKYTYINPKLSVKEVKKYAKRWIPFSEIYRERFYNYLRTAGMKNSDIDTLSESLKNGIDFSLPLPIVEIIVPKHTENGVVHYQLNSGYHRIEILESLGYTGYWFDVIEVLVPSASVGMGVYTNTRPPQSELSNVDIEQAIIGMINKGQLKNDEIDIVTWLKKWTPFSKGRMTTICNRVIGKTGGTPKQMLTWTGIPLEKQLTSMGLSFGGDEDSEGNIWYASLGPRYTRDTAMNALLKYAETNGKVSKIALHVESCIDLGELTQLRKNQIAHFERMEKAFKKAVEIFNATGETPWKLEGCIYQDNVNEKEFEKKLIPIAAIK